MAATAFSSQQGNADTGKFRFSKSSEFQRAMRPSGWFCTEN
jgi:hypothetical protein